MATIDELFKGMAEKDINGGGNYMKEGLFEVQIKSIAMKVGGFKGNSFICEFEILKSSNPAHVVGSTSSFVLNMSNAYAMGNISELVIACLGHENTKENQTNRDIRDQVALVTRAACGSDAAAKELAELRAALEQPSFGALIGVKLKLETTKKPTKPSVAKPQGGEFTVHKWSPLTATAPAAAA